MSKREHDENIHCHRSDGEPWTSNGTFLAHEPETRVILAVRDTNCGQRVAADNAPDVLDWFSAAPDGSRRDSDARQLAVGDKV